MSNKRIFVRKREGYNKEELHTFKNPTNRESLRLIFECRPSVVSML